MVDNNEAAVAELEKVAHFIKALEGTIHDAPMDVDELTSGPFKVSQQ